MLASGQRLHYEIHKHFVRLPYAAEEEKLRVADKLQTLDLLKRINGSEPSPKMPRWTTDYPYTRKYELYSWGPKSGTEWSRTAEYSSIRIH